MRIFIIVVIAIVALASIFLWYSYLSDIPAPLTALPEKSVTESKREIKLAPLVYEERLSSRVSDWAQDPFVTQKTDIIGDLKVEAISVDADGRGFVLINGETHRENDIVGIYKIIKIDRDYIVVEGGGSNIILKIEKGE